MTSGVGGGIRYDNGEMVYVALLTPMNVNLSVTRKLGRRTTISTELTAQPSLATLWATGINYVLRGSTFRFRVDSDLKVTAIVEEVVSNWMKVGACAELDHWKKQYKFGLSMSMFA